jgi:hypothetical protein
MANSHDDRRSVTWICFSLSFATMSWTSRKQKFVTLSTAEAEYIAVCDACMEAMWILKLVLDHDMLELCEAFRETSVP